MDAKVGTLFRGFTKGLCAMKTISSDRWRTAAETAAMCACRGRTITAIPHRLPLQSLKLFPSWFDMPPISLYSTKTCWATAGICRHAGKRFYGSFVHSRDLYVLLSGRRRAGVSFGLDSGNLVSDRQRPTSPTCAVGLCFWRKFYLFSKTPACARMRFHSQEFHFALISTTDSRTVRSLGWPHR